MTSRKSVNILMAKVSICIPTYNRCKLLIEAIESVQRQTIGDIEIIVIDDGSTDNTTRTVSQIKDSRIKYFYKENGGLSSARNVGIANSKGKYVAFLDSDDIYTEKYLEIMTGRLEENKDFGMAYSRFKDVYPDGRREFGFKNASFLSGNLTRYYFGQMPCIIPSATVLRREILKDFHFDEKLKLTEDIDFFLRLSAKTKVLAVPDAMVLRRIFGDNLSIQSQKNICPNTALTLERFFCHLNGGDIVPAELARKKISREYRSLARTHIKAGNRIAAIKLMKKAISYYPWDYHYYKKLLKTLCMSRKKDKMPDWQMPEPLPPYITVNNRKIPFSV